MASLNARVLITLAAAGALAAAQARAQGGGDTPGSFDRWQYEGYKPTDAVLTRWNAERALDVLREIAGLKPKSPEVHNASGMLRLKLFIDRRAISMFRPVADVKRAEIYEDRIELDLTRQDRGPSTYYFEEMPDLEVVRDTIFEAMYGVPISKDRQWYLWCSDGGLIEENRAGCARLLADALHVLRKSFDGQQTDEQKFKEIAAHYRKQNPRPRIPEEVRRYKVQAEFMIDQRRYADAIRIYGEGLKVAPWWPDGRFNRALLLAEAKRYREAILEMNRFLQLEPDARDARAAQDNVYKWEAMLNAGIGGRSQ